MFKHLILYDSAKYVAIEKCYGALKKIQFAQSAKSYESDLSNNKK
jgi:hypothetical protein